MWLVAAADVTQSPLFAKELPAAPDRAPPNNVQGRETKANDANVFPGFQAAKCAIDGKGPGYDSLFRNGLRKTEFVCQDCRVRPCGCCAANGQHDGIAPELVPVAQVNHPFVTERLLHAGGCRAMTFDRDRRGYPLEQFSEDRGKVASRVRARRIGINRHSVVRRSGP